MTSLDSFRCCKTLQVGSKTFAYFSLPIAERNGLKGISRLPFSMKVLLENLLRNEDGRTVTKDDIKAVADWLKTKTSDHEIAFRPPVVHDAFYQFDRRARRRRERCRHLFEFSIDHIVAHAAAEGLQEEHRAAAVARARGGAAGAGDRNGSFCGSPNSAATGALLHTGERQTVAPPTGTWQMP